jgi:TolA-binding protein
MMRLRWTFVLAGASLLILLDGSPAQAQASKKGKTGDARLRQTIQKLQAELSERNQRIQQLQAQVNRLNTQLKTKKTTKQTREQTKELQDLRKSVKDLEALKNAQYVHAIILRLKKDAPDREVVSLLTKAPKTLGKIPGVRGVWVGKPASIASESAQTDFQVGVVVLFDDDTAMKRFLNDASQKKFFEGLSKFWEMPTIYDFLP